MAGGCIDLFTTRRTYFYQCNYWRVDDLNKNINELVNEQKPTGRFYAKKENAETNQGNVVGGAFMFDANSITISTADDIDIQKNDAVLFDGEVWRVRDVQSNEIEKQAQLRRKPSRKTYISLIR